MNEVQLKNLVIKKTFGMNDLEKTRFLRSVFSKVYKLNIEGQDLYVSTITIEREINEVLKELDYTDNFKGNKYFIDYILQKVIDIESNNKSIINKIAKNNNTSYENVLDIMNKYYDNNNKNNISIDKMIKTIVIETRKRLINRERNKTNQEKWNKLLQK